MTNKNLIGYIAVGIICLLIGWGIASSLNGPHFGATVENFPDWFSVGLNLGKDGPKTNTVNAIYSASFTQNAFTLGSITQSTSTKFVTTTVTSRDAAVGDYCGIGLTTVPTTTPFFAYGSVQSVTAGVATVGISYQNGTSTSVTVATGTTSLYCENTPF